MKAWVTTTFSGRCAYDGTHTWKLGERVFSVKGAEWSRAKLFCPACAVARHKAGPDTGEAPPEVSLPPFAPLRALAQAAGQRFDARAAASGERDE